MVEGPVLTRREALSKLLRYLVTGGSLAVVWGYLKGLGPASVKVSFSKRPQENEVIFQEGVYLVGREEGPSAFAAKCPHLGCRLDYRPGSEQFRCPCHGSKFALNGKWLKGPARRDMRALDVKSEKGSKACCVTLTST